MQKASKAIKLTATEPINPFDENPLQLAQILASLGVQADMSGNHFYQAPKAVNAGSTGKGDHSEDMESEDGEGDDDMGTGAGSSRRGSGKSDDKLRARRERNKLAARRCREKKMSHIQLLEKQLSQSVKENQSLAQHVSSLAILYSKEHKLKEEFKSLLRAMPGSESRRYNGQSINEVITSIEAGTLDVDRALTIMSATPAEAAAAEFYATTAPNGIPVIRANSGSCLPPGSLSSLVTAATAQPAAPASPSPATAAAMSMAIAMSAAGSGGSSCSELGLDGLGGVCRMQGQPSCDAPAAPAN